MTSAVELAQVWVPLMPEASRLAGGVERIGREAERRFGRATKVMGSQMASSLTANTRKAVDAGRALERQTLLVEKAKRAQADAEGRVLVATKKSQEVYAREKSTASQRAAASEAYSRVKRAEMATTENLAREEKKLAAATRENAAAQSAAKNAMTRGGGMRLPMGAQLLSQAEQYGADSGTRFVTGMKRVMGPVAGLAIGGGFVASIKNVVNAGLSYEKSMNSLSGVTSATGAEMAAARQKARDLGVDTTIVGASAADAGQAMTELAKGGLTLADSMTAARGTLQLAAAAQVSAGEAATIQASALNAFNLSADQAGNVADYLANTANASVGDIGDFAQGLQQAGGVANGFGLSIQDTLAALGMLANAGIKGSDAGTLLKTSLQSITDQGNPAQGAIAALGLTLYDTQGKFVGYRSMLEQVAAAHSRMTDEEFQAQTNILFGSDAMRGAMVGNIEDFDKMKVAVTNYGGAARLAEANMQGLPGVVEKISNTAEGAKLALFDLIDPALQAGGNKMVAFLSKTADAVNDIGKGGGGAGMQAIRDGWRDISAAAKDLAPAAGKAVKALSTGVGTTAVAAWRALGGVVSVIEPPLKLIADLLGNNQGMTTGLVAVMGALYLKSKLTGPVLTAAAKATDMWTRSFGGWKTSAAEAAKQGDTMRGWATRMRDSYSTASSEAERFKRTAGFANGAMQGMKSAAGGLMGAFGGPWTLAITGATALIGALMQKHADAAAAARQHNEDEKALQATLDPETGAVTEKTRQDIATRFSDRGEDGKGVSTADRAISYGIDTNQLIAAATGDAAVYAELQKKAADAVTAGIAAGGNKSRMQMQDLGSAGVSPEEMTKALLHEGDAWDVVNQKIKDWTTAQQAANPDFANTMTNGLQSIVDVMPDVNESLITMLQQVNDAARSTGRSTDAQRQYVQMLNGTWKATEEGKARFAALGAQILEVPSDKTITTTALTDEAKRTLTDLGYTVENLRPGEVKVTATTDEALRRIQDLVEKVANQPLVLDVRANTAARIANGEVVTHGGRAAGGRVGANGMIYGPGSGTSDSILAAVLGGGTLRVSNRESINTAASTRANWPVIDAMNRGANLSRWFKQLPRRAEGGIVGLEDAVDEMSGTPYQRGGFSPSAADCTGAMSYLVNRALGRPNSSRMATGSAADWLAAAGFVSGPGPEGTFRLGWKNGGPGGGHMAGTLPDGRNVEQGGSVGNFMAGGSVGADDPQFTNQAYLPMEALYPDGDAYGSGGGSGAMGYGSGGSGGGAGSGGGGGPTRAEQRALRNAEQKVDDTKLAVTRAQQAVDEAKTDKQRTAATDRLTKANREAADAEDDLASKREDVNEKVADRASKGGTSADGKRSGPDAKSFGSDLLSGLMEGIGLDGSVFGNPMEWGIFKTGVGLLNWFGGVAKATAEQRGNPMGASGYAGDPSSSRHGRGAGSPGPGNAGPDPAISDGGFGDIGMGVVQSLLPNVGDWLPNATNGGGTNTTNTTNNQNSGNTDRSVRQTFTGPVRFDSPQGAPDRVRTYSSGLPR